LYENILKLKQLECNEMLNINAYQTKIFNQEKNEMTAFLEQKTIQF